jgi:hypothetical protein
LTTRRVSTPDGVVWSVRRRWLPHREGKGVVQRFRKHSKPNAGDFADLPLGIGDGAAGLVVALVIGIALVLLLVFGWPVILLGIDLVWLLLVGVLGVIGRIVLRRPWRVEAVSRTERRSWFVKGYRAAGRERDEIARRFQHGQNPTGVETAPMPH